MSSFWNQTTFLNVGDDTSHVSRANSFQKDAVLAGGIHPGVNNDTNIYLLLDKSVICTQKMLIYYTTYCIFI